jgi:hypothetical protein
MLHVNVIAARLHQRLQPQRRVSFHLALVAAGNQIDFAIHPSCSASSIKLFFGFGFFSFSVAPSDSKSRASAASALRLK